LARFRKIVVGLHGSFWQILSPLVILLNDDSVALMRFAMEAIDDGAAHHDQGEFFYSFRLDEAVPDDHP
jgi:hypothetical protein